MSGSELSCSETPLKWPADVNMDSVTVRTDSGIRVKSSWPGSLQLISRRINGGKGDGVNIEENAGITVDYRGQIYNYVEAIFHVPGLHVFPGQSDPYGAEYHIHLQTIMKPQRQITIVLPIKQATGDKTGNPYFMACRRTVDPGIRRPSITTLFTPGTTTLQYSGSDIRNRTKDNPVTTECNPGHKETQFILVLEPLYIRATDLERIPRVDTSTTDPRDLPVPGITPKIAIPRNRLLQNVIKAEPGVIGPDGVAQLKPDIPDCKVPEVIESDEPVTEEQGTSKYMFSIIFGIGLFIGAYVTDLILNIFLWGVLFDSEKVYTMEPLKAYFLIAMSAGGIFLYDWFLRFTFWLIGLIYR